MTTSEKYSKELAKVAEKIALEAFDKKEEPHQFSKSYQQRKKDFMTGITEENRQKKYRKRLIAIVAGLLIGIPTTAFAAKKLYDIVVKQENYEVKISVKETSKGSQATNTKKEIFYKLSPGYLPENMSDFNERGMKYWYQENYGMGGFSFLLWKIDKAADFSKLYAADYKEVIFGKNKGVITTQVGIADSSDMNRHVYMFFQEENFVLEAYVGDDVSDSDLEKVLSHMSLEPTTEEQASYYQVYEDVKNMGDYQQQLTVKPLKKDHPQLIKVGDEASFGNFNFTIEEVEVRQSIAGLEETNFNRSSLERIQELQVIDVEGNLMPYEHQHYQRGDGKKTLDKVVDSKVSQPKFVYVTATLESLSNHSIEDLLMQSGLTFLEETKSGWTYSDSEELIYEPQVLSGEVDYLDSHGEAKGFYKMPKIEPQEKRTIHFGYFVDEAQLSSMFINLFYYGGVSDNVEDLGANDRWWGDIRQ